MNKLYEEFRENVDHNRNNITTIENLACYLAIVTCSRIQNILSASYSFKKSQTDMYELIFATTKTTSHSILVNKKIKKRLEKFKHFAEKTTYSKVLVFCKNRFMTGTHVCRRSAASIMKNSGIFTQEDIKCYGNWSTRDCLSSSYLRSCSLVKACKFWTDITD